MLKKESSSACGKDRYEYEEVTDEVTGNKVGWLGFMAYQPL